MITIEGKDIPIAAAFKIIDGVRPSCGDGIQDHFSLEELKEIADYLMVYYNAHIKGSDEDD